MSPAPRRFRARSPSDARDRGRPDYILFDEHPTPTLVGEEPGLRILAASHQPLRPALGKADRSTHDVARSLRIGGGANVSAARRTLDADRLSPIAGGGKVSL
jgi:hypothetical protein